MQTLLVSLNLLISGNESGAFSPLPSCSEGVSVLKAAASRFSFIYIGCGRLNRPEILRSFLLDQDFPQGDLLCACNPLRLWEKEKEKLLQKNIVLGLGGLEDNPLHAAIGCMSLMVHPLSLTWNDVLLRLQAFPCGTETIRPVAYIRTGFSEKFGIPRQSGLVKELCGTLVFEPEFRRREAVKELEGFSHLWLIWQFSRAVSGGWRPTVRPPRLGGNRRVGVFASRSPFRPNHLGLSCVKLEAIDLSAKEGPILLVSGVDMLDGTPVYDIKPYVPVADRPSEVQEGYTGQTRNHLLTVDFPSELAALLPENILQALKGVLASDPRPGYEDSPDEIYGLSFSGFDIGFRVSNHRVQVLRVTPLAP